MNTNKAAQDRKVICVMGPTASGKTGLGIELVECLNGEIISVDSAMVYKGMDIGTAKPTPEELARAPHRLIDIIDPAEAYSAANFREDAIREANEIFAKGKVPIFVGGTMLYYRALLSGLSDLPQADERVRKKLEDELAQFGLGKMHQRLQQIDHESAARIHPNDPQRIQRALEVYEITGKPLTQLFEEQKREQAPFQAIKVALQPDERSKLHEKIEQRFRLMLEHGFIEEVEGLRSRGDLDLTKPSMRAVGYRQVWEYLDGNRTYEQMLEKGVASTRQLAKRQITWLRAEDGLTWFDGENPQLVENVLSFMAGLI
ncbi:MAG: tRNA (adenosine(37)-N6)-dimethylallyltransferase MiaA [Gammaproteobacteria bacterium]|nr:MAG: tRNA (adenosine(37)-N6)-dimethylallyltransferase MiaA [Gammaproteobacteria bacterium]